MEFFKIKEEPVLDLTEDSDGGEQNEIKSEGIPIPPNTTTQVTSTSDEPDDQKYTLQVYSSRNFKLFFTLYLYILRSCSLRHFYFLC